MKNQIVQDNIWHIKKRKRVCGTDREGNVKIPRIDAEDVRLGLHNVAIDVLYNIIRVMLVDGSLECITGLLSLFYTSREIHRMAISAPSFYVNRSTESSEHEECREPHEFLALRMGNWARVDYGSVEKKMARFRQLFGHQLGDWHRITTDPFLRTPSENSKTRGSVNNFVRGATVEMMLPYSPFNQVDNQVCDDLVAMLDAEATSRGDDEYWFTHADRCALIKHRRPKYVLRCIIQSLRSLDADTARRWAADDNSDVMQFLPKIYETGTDVFFTVLSHFLRTWWMNFEGRKNAQLDMLLCALRDNLPFSQEKHTEPALRSAFDFLRQNIPNNNFQQDFLGGIKGFYAVHFALKYLDVNFLKRLFAAESPDPTLTDYLKTLLRVEGEEMLVQLFEQPDLTPDQMAKLRVFPITDDSEAANAYSHLCSVYEPANVEELKYYALRAPDKETRTQAKVLWDVHPKLVENMVQLTVDMMDYPEWPEGFVEYVMASDLETHRDYVPAILSSLERKFAQFGPDDGRNSLYTNALRFASEFYYNNNRTRITTFAELRGNAPLITKECRKRGLFFLNALV